MPVPAILVDDSSDDRALVGGADNERSATAAPHRCAVAHEVLLHVGYHKTGTTWLQSGLFGDAGIGFERPWSSAEIRSELVLQDPLEWTSRRAVERFAPAAAALAAVGRIPVLSDERLSGSPHAGGFDSAQIADRLAAVFPRGRVLIVIREQRQALYSVYQQYVRDGGAASLQKYLEPRRTAEVPQFRWQHFEYDRLVARYQALFGPERVLVLAFELLRHDPAAFLRAILAFAGREAAAGAPTYPPEYTSLRAATVVLKRWFNRALVRNALNPSAPFYVKDHERRFERVDRSLPALFSRPIERRWRALLERATAGRFEESNARTAELTGLDLQVWGYAMPAGAGATGPSGGAGA